MAELAVTPGDLSASPEVNAASLVLAVGDLDRELGGVRAGYAVFTRSLSMPVV